MLVTKLHCIGETGESMHTRAKFNLTKSYSRVKETREGSVFFKPIKNKHGSLKRGEKGYDYFDIFIIKAYKKPLPRNIEEGTLIINYQGEILNSKKEWHQPKIIRITVFQGWAEMVGGEVQRFPRNGGSRTTTPGVGDVKVIARNVEQTAVPQVNTRSRTTARLQGQ